MILNILRGMRKLAVSSAADTTISSVALGNFSPVAHVSVRNYSVPKRKLVKKQVFVYRNSMKSRYKANPNPRLKMLLLQDVEGLGMKEDVVEVKRALGRNNLIPNKLAIYATPENLLNNGIDPSILKKSGGSKVPSNVIKYLKKSAIKLFAPSDDDFLITRHDVAEYFLRHSNLYVPVYCMRIRETENDIIVKLGTYILDVTVNSCVTVQVSLEVICRESITEEK
ncbi:large ribosomal subunit protein bL9m [Hydra vulgaris]|uniref:Large ribosomal subunit protein bL9m n=1 Tax=Hydra vulgaris TaxID=6087 RepID=A0ABM4BFN5_HYDVU